MPKVFPFILQGLDLHGQGLVSTSRLDLPRTFQEEGGDINAIRSAIKGGVTRTAGELNGRIDAWNVVDRPCDDQDLLNLIGCFLL